MRRRGLQGPLPHGGRAGTREGGQRALQAHREPSRLGPAAVGSPPGKWGHVGARLAAHGRAQVPPPPHHEGPARASWPLPPIARRH
eukprot:7844754-Alexandrium_andersonii.AAC.1